jgi:hypothetical protein
LIAGPLTLQQSVQLWIFLIPIFLIQTLALSVPNITIEYLTIRMVFNREVLKIPHLFRTLAIVNIISYPFTTFLFFIITDQLVRPVGFIITMLLFAESIAVFLEYLIYKRFWYPKYINNIQTIFKVSLIANLSTGLIAFLLLLLVLVI